MTWLQGYILRTFDDQKQYKHFVLTDAKHCPHISIAFEETECNVRSELRPLQEELKEFKYSLHIIYKTLMQWKENAFGGRQLTAEMYRDAQDVSCFYFLLHWLKQH